MKIYLMRHLQVLVATLGDFARHPSATLLTVAMIGVTLALPAGLYAGLLNVERFTRDWHGQMSLAVYLKKAAPGNQATAVIQRLPGVRRARYISPEAGLQELAREPGMGHAIRVLHANPLPGVVLVTPRAIQPAALQDLVAQLKARPDVAHVQSNIAWLERLNAALALGRRLVLVLSALLSFALILILSNTTRAAVASRSTEIEVIRLVGGTPAFIRRPFLYAGAITGVFGALCALLLLEIALFALNGPLHRLDALYASTYSLTGLTWRQAWLLLALGGGLGWLGARLAVGWHIRKDGLS